MSKDKKWYQFQEDICKHFQSIGAEAATNVTVQGVRTKHDIDVLVQTKYLGEDLTWVIEAKHWKCNVPKEKVLALRTIVDDIGADKGFIISLSGFQAGAIEAAQSSNISLKTFEELKEATSALIEDSILSGYEERARLLDKKYWSHSKYVRREYDLRPELCDNSLRFSGADVLSRVAYALGNAKRQTYPIHVGTSYSRKAGEDIVNNFQELQNWLNLNLNLLDYELMRAEYLMMKNEDFKPDLVRLNPDYERTSLFQERLKALTSDNPELKKLWFPFESFNEESK